MMNRRRALKWAGAAGLLGLGGVQTAPAQEPRGPQDKPPEPGRLDEAVVRSQVGLQTDEIHAVAFSPDGSKVLTGGNLGYLMTVVDANSLDGSGRPPRIITTAPNPVLKLWDALTGHLDHIFADHPTPILVAAFSPDASRVVSGGAAHYRAADEEMYANRERRVIVGSRNKLGDVIQVDHLVKVWDVASGKELHAFQGPGGVTTAVAFGREVVAIDSHDIYRLWDPKTGEPDNRSLDCLMHETEYRRNPYRPNATFSADGLRAMAIRGNPLMLKQWDAAKGRARKWETPKGSANSIMLDPEGKSFATSSLKQILLWDFESRKLVREFDGLDEEVAGSLQGFSPDGSLLASGARDDTVHVWDVASGRRIASARGTERNPGPPRGHIRAVAFLPNGNVRVASGGWATMSPMDKGEMMAFDEATKARFAKREPLLVWDFKI